ncbi:NACHT domain-containing protein [Streptomyces himalayensis]|uniref:NACHT domain-containing protein n=1 Tax=Streptomyces himalayensis subsp. himalayensis TaxID=2756131 RepID=A0A7W0DQW0_9ACTN|nr:NACHT domain-containing protein [Streptomyces himalayensis]MBA2949589.1 NACHT domain-containing protein [Streptomyces himalayensis subsp. himalayensis]
MSRSTVWGSLYQVDSGGGDVTLQHEGNGDIIVALPQQHEALLGWAQTLASSVRRQEADVRDRLLADAGDPEAADLEFHRTELDLVRWRDDEKSGDGSLSTIAAFYTGLRRGRLVVLGNAGAGKTVLVMQLLLDLIDSQKQEPTERGRLVPVRLSLPSFEDSRLASPDMAPATVAKLLDDWIVRQISSGAHPLKRRHARELVRAGWVLPILDGLDEMDPEGADPTRALAVIRALNTHGHHGPQPIVVTCRADLYRRLEQSSSPAMRPGEVPVLQDAAVVSLLPLDIDRVRQHLAYRFPGRSPDGKVADRWRPIDEHLTNHPDSPLARLLCSPLWLFVTVATYLNHGKPEELTRLPEGGLRDFLLARLLPESVAQHQYSGTGYSESEVRQWLGTLARHLAMARQQGRSGADFYPHQLWRVAGGYMPRIVSMVLQGVLTALFLLFALSHYHATTSYWIPPYAPGRALLLAGLLLVIWVIARAGRSAARLRGLDTSLLRTPSGRRRMLFALVWPVAGLTVGYAFGIWFSQGYGPRVGQAYGLSFVSVGLVLATEIVLARRPSAVSQPSRLMGQALAFQAVVLTCYGLAFSAGFGAANLAAYPWLSWTAFGDGAVLGLWLGLAIGIGRTCDSAWTLYAIAVPILIAHRRFPRRRLGPFLDWAYDAGLFRLSGIAVQFRHHALQDWIGRDTRPIA